VTDFPTLLIEKKIKEKRIIEMNLAREAVHDRFVSERIAG